MRGGQPRHAPRRQPQACRLRCCSALPALLRPTRPLPPSPHPPRAPSRPARQQEEQLAFEAWRDSLETVPTIKALRGKAESIRAGELEKTLNKLGEGLTNKQKKVRGAAAGRAGRAGWAEQCLQPAAAGSVLRCRRATAAGLRLWPAPLALARTLLVLALAHSPRPQPAPHRRQVIEELSKGIVNKLLHGPMTALRCDGADAETVAQTLANMEALERMFGLGEEEGLTPAQAQKVAAAASKR